MGNTGANLTKNLKHQSPQDQAAEQGRERKAIAAILRGATYEQAAEAAGYANKSGAYKAVQRVLARNAEDLRDKADQFRALEIARLDRAMMEITHVAFDRTQSLDMRLKFLEALRRNVETRARILGLNAPIVHEVISHDALDREIAQLRDRVGLPAGWTDAEIIALGSGEAAQAGPHQGAEAP